MWKNRFKSRRKNICWGGDNAVAAIGSGILNSQNILCSIGTSGVVLADEKSPHTPYEGTLQMEHHAIPEHFYSMGVTLAAGESLSWFKNTFFPQKSFSDLLSMAQESNLGADKLFLHLISMVKGLLFRLFHSWKLYRNK
ncbi:hypothetical protein SDC49_23195 [Lactobacillus sp. R2/2]|nr:hypothetical protein [Lactobacillus sp. R2/2]MEB3365371.1 hypothetical protein [Lactobacillus sp. R2/2]